MFKKSGTGPVSVLTYFKDQGKLLKVVQQSDTTKFLSGQPKQYSTTSYSDVMVMLISLQYFGQPHLLFRETRCKAWLSKGQPDKLLKHLPCILCHITPEKCMS